MPNRTEVTDHQQPNTSAAPPCPTWCTRPELEHQSHQGVWDYDEDDSRLSRHHFRDFGGMVNITGYEYSSAPGVIVELQIRLWTDDNFHALSAAEAAQLSRHLDEAAQWLEAHR